MLVSQPTGDSQVKSSQIDACVVLHCIVSEIDQGI